LPGSALVKSGAAGRARIDRVIESVAWPHFANRWSGLILGASLIFGPFHPQIGTRQTLTQTT